MIPCDKYDGDVFYDYDCGICNWVIFILEFFNSSEADSIPFQFSDSRSASIPR